MTTSCGPGPRPQIASRRPCPCTDTGSALGKAKPRSSMWLAYPKLIHANKRRRILSLEGLPAIELRHRRVVRETLSETLQDMSPQLESEKFQAVLPHKVTDLGERQLSFLNVKQQVATGAGAKEIHELRCPLQRRIIAMRHELLAAPPDVLCRRTIAALRNEGARIIDVPPCRSAVKAQTHETARPQNR